MTERPGAPTPRLGLFWVAPNPRGTWGVRDLSRPFAAVPEIGGFRTLDEGHVDAWPQLGGHLDPDYGAYPRGRVNWRAEDGRFLLLHDPVLSRDGWIARVAECFVLPPSRTLVMTDAHYRSRVRPPAGA
ncbi:hypothetical protein [Roseomonas chloroacetimidivorans]|uniref:hypothetical protein n=1 Tax=Roseomonas chloroacetimidivorans TaxID=1766656 RepID=UPI003C73ABD7